MTPVANRKSANPSRAILLAWTALVFAFLFLPIAVIIIYSFNDGRNLYVWAGWSVRWYEAAMHNSRVLDALQVSINAALINAVIAVMLGVPTGIALARRKGRWTRPTLILIVIIVGIPELVSAIGQMIWLDRLGIFHGLGRLAIGHSLFNTAIVTMIVHARAEGTGELLEQAAADLGAVPWRAFKDVTLPLMLPAVFAGFLLAFTFSLDDVIISLFVQRPGTSTLPIYILSSLKAGLRGDVAALATAVLCVSIAGIVVAAVLLMRGSNGRGRKPFGF